MEKEACLAKFDSIVKSFSADDRIALAPDLDAEGISSGAITYNAIKLLRGRAPDLVITQPYKTVELLPKTIALLKKKKITKLIVVDSALDQQPSSIEAEEKIVSQILVIDHHKDYAPTGLKKTFVIKPQFISDVEPSRYPSAKLAFDLFSRHADMKKCSWIACMGLMGDNQLGQWRDFVESSAAEHSTNVDELWKAVQVISAVETLAP